MFKRWRWLLSLLLIATVLVLLVYHPLLLGKTLLFGDNYSLMVPGKLFTANWIGRGVLPFWNPYIFAGISWIGDVNQSILYPSTLLFVWLRPAVALNITIVLHLILSFVGMVLLSRRLGVASWAQYLAAVLWTFAPQLTGSVNNIATVQSLSWMPWVVWAGLSIKKPIGIVIFVLMVSAQLLGGYPQHVLYSIGLAVAIGGWQWWVERSAQNSAQHRFSELIPWVVRWAVVGALVVATTAFIWAPFYPTLRQSTRSEQSAEQAAAGSLQLIELVKIVVPTAFDSPAQGMKWGPSWNKPPNVVLFFSWFGIALAVMAVVQKKVDRFDAFLLSIAGISALIALGNSLPTFALLQKIPILNAARGISTILMIPALLGSLLIARWVTRVSISQKSLKYWSVALLVVIGMVLGLWLLIYVAFDQLWYMLDGWLNMRLSQSVFHTLARDRVIISVNVWTVLVLSSSLLISLWLWFKKRHAALIVVLACELAFVTQAHLFYAPLAVYDLDTEMLAPITAQIDTEQYRMLTRNYNSPYTDFGAYWDAISVRSPFSDSYIDHAELSTYAHLQRMRDGLTPNWNMVAEVPVINGYTTLLPLDLQRQFSAEPAVSINNLPQIMLDNPALEQWSVRYYLVDNWFPTYDEEMPVDVVATASPSWTLYELPSALPRFRFSNGEAAAVQIIDENPNRISFSVEAAEINSLIQADRFTSDWQVTINGQEKELVEEQGMRNMSLQPGLNTIELRYAPTNFYRGLVVSVVTLLGLLIWVSVTWYFGRQNK